MTHTALDDPRFYLNRHLEWLEFNRRVLEEARDIGNPLLERVKFLAITANNQTKLYGAALPTLTASYSGFVNGDTSASLTTLPLLSTTAIASSPVAGNPYSITASGAVDSDYTISYVAGTLTAEDYYKFLEAGWENTQRILKGQV